MEEVYNFIKKDIELKSDDVIVIGVSGGPDSMALLYIMNEFKNKIGFKIVCAHVNHNKRLESEQEKIDLEKYCKEQNIELMSFYIDTSMWNCSIRALQREPNLDDKDIMELHRRLLDDYYNVLPAKDYCNHIVKNNTQQDFIETVLKISEVVK